ncbi:MAG TPA: transglutaminase-like domain-containing protein [Anaerolineales bacterium]|nr:transglutaminase-like domain-containing protein [Anaerolineales bacterium]
MIGRFLRKLVSAEVIGGILILVALQSLTYGISFSLLGTDTRQQWGYFFWVCVLAALIAFGLSKRKLNGIQASVGMIVLGTLGVWILGARLTSPLLNLGNAILSLTPQIIPSIRFHIPMDTTAVTNAWLVVSEASYTLSQRVQVWLYSLDRNVSVSDTLVRNMVWILIMWLISAWMGWFAAKRNAAVALLPSMLLLAAVTSYSRYRIEMVWVLVFVLLLLMGLWNYKNHIKHWETHKVDYSDSIGYDVGQAVVFLSLVVGLVALITPSISWREIRDFLRERNQASQNEAADLLGIRQRQVAGQKPSVQKPILPRDHLLTGGYAQSEKVVMTIRTGELPPVGNPYFTVDAPRHYWRSVTYDTYVGAGWITGSTVAQGYPANTPLIPGLLNGYGTLHLDVKIAEPEGKLFWSGVLFSADIPFTANWRLRPQSSLFADQSTLLQADMFAALSKAQSYQAESYIPLVTVEELRLASTDYPKEIRDRYLELPASLPERVRQLAKEITKGKTKEYDQAKAIEAYLRTYPYDLNVPAPPEDRDVADYFLFDLKKGYCDYYATAMVVLARASGIPARFVSGYSPGSYEPASAEYIVRELNAHSWAEVYFPEIGWIEFEPTASQPEIELVPSKSDITSTPPPDSVVMQLLNRFRLIKTIYWVSPLAVIFLVPILYFTLIERWLYLRLAPATAVEKIYRRLYRLGRPLAGERTKAETAYEFMRKLVNRIDTLRVKKGARFTKLFSRAQQDVEHLTDMYQDTLFGYNNIQKKDARNALRTWKRLRLRLLLARLSVTASSAGRVSRPSAKQTLY